MANQVWFGSGDLLEYVRPVVGDPRFDEPIRVRAIVLEFDVFIDGEVVVTLIEGARSSFRKTERDEIAGVPVTEQMSQIYMERQLTRWKLNQLIGFDPEVVRRGNSSSEMTHFVVE